MESLARRGKRGTKSKEREEREWGRGSDGDGVVGVEFGGREWGAQSVSLRSRPAIDPTPVLNPREI